MNKQGSAWLICAKNEGFITNGTIITYNGQRVACIVETGPITLRIYFKGTYLQNINELLKEKGITPGGRQRSQLAFWRGNTNEPISYDEIKDKLMNKPTTMVSHLSMDKEHNISTYVFFFGKEWRVSLGTSILSLLRSMKIDGKGNFIDEDGTKISQDNSFCDLCLANRFVWNEEREGPPFIKIKKFQSFESPCFPLKPNSLYDRVYSRWSKIEYLLGLKWCENFDSVPIRFKENKFQVIECNNEYFAASNSCPFVMSNFSTLGEFFRNYLKAPWHRAKYGDCLFDSLLMEGGFHRGKVGNIEYKVDIHHCTKITPCSMLDSTLISSQFPYSVHNKKDNLITETAAQSDFGNRYFSIKKGIGIQEGNASPLLVHYIVIGKCSPPQRFEIEFIESCSGEQQFLVPKFSVQAVDTDSTTTPLGKVTGFLVNEKSTVEDDSHTNRFAFDVPLDQLQDNVLGNPTKLVISPIQDDKILHQYSLETPYFRAVSFDRFFDLSNHIHDALYPRLLKIIRTLRQEIVIQGYYLGIPSITKISCSFYEDERNQNLIDQEVVPLDNWHQFTVNSKLLKHDNIFIELEAKTLHHSQEEYRRRIWSPNGFRVRIPSVQHKEHQFFYWDTYSLPISEYKFSTLHLHLSRLPFF